MGDVRTKRLAHELETAILAALERPLSRRELWQAVAGGKEGKAAERALARLLASGAVAEIGTRRSFDFGSERLLKKC